MSPNETTPIIQSTPTEPSAQAPKKRNAVILVLAGALLVVVAAALLYFTNPGGIFSSRDDTATVSITSSGFDPATIKVKKGQTVEWTNVDNSPHQPASDPYPDHSLLPAFFVDEPLAKGESFVFTFEDVGTFTYHDHLKPADFKGTVIVE